MRYVLAIAENQVSYQPVRWYGLGGKKHKQYNTGKTRKKFTVHFLMDKCKDPKACCVKKWA